MKWRVFQILVFRNSKQLLIHCSNKYSHKRENVYLQKLNKNGINCFWLDLRKNKFQLLFQPGPRCFCFLQINPIIFFLLSPPPTLLHRRQPSWPAHHGVAKPARPCGPSAPIYKISRYRLRKPPCGGIPLPRALLAPRRAPAGASVTTTPRFFPWSRLPLRLEPRPPSLPSRL
jgi:hypothetical protein